MIIYSATELLKAGHKYTRRWKGKDGNWNYEYSRLQGGGRRKSPVRQNQMEGIFGQEHAEAIQSGGGGTMQLRSGEGFKRSPRADGSGPYKDGTGPNSAGVKARRHELREDIDRFFGGSTVDKILRADKVGLEGYMNAHDEKIREYAEIVRNEKFGMEVRQNDVSYESSSQVMRDTAMAYKDTIPPPVKINAKIRTRLNKAVNKAFPGNYYDNIPLSEIDAVLQTEGFILIQEDNTKWSGFLTGDNAEAFFEMGDLSSGRMVNGMMTYAMVENSGLRMTWYKMNSNKYEVIKYIT